jgi:hypothetical protein
VFCAGRAAGLGSIFRDGSRQQDAQDGKTMQLARKDAKHGKLRRR